MQTGTGKSFNSKNSYSLEKIIADKEHTAVCRTTFLYGKDLIFISRILRDGSGVVNVSECGKCISVLDEKLFHINSLSITHQTYIATEFNSYVVKIK